MRAATLIAILAALVLMAGCGGSDGGTSGESTTGQAEMSARDARDAFLAESSCRRPPGASRWGCSIDTYRCQAVVVDRGWSVSCARPGGSVGFLVRR